jgi:hypothetical protein
MAAADKTTEKDPFELDWSGIVEDFKVSEMCRPHRFNVRTQADVGNCFIHAAVYLRNGNILMADYPNRSVKLFTNDGQLKDELVSEVSELELIPYGITMLDSTTAAVTYHMTDRSDGLKPVTRMIKLISVEERLFVQSEFDLPFPMCLQSQMVCGYNGQLAVTCEDEKCVYIVTRDGKLTKTISNLFASTKNVASNQAGTVLYVVDQRANQLVAVTDEGEVKFRYKHPKLSYPTCVSVDASDNVYVCGHGSKNVHQVTADGQHKSILPIIDIGYWVISFQPDTDNFLLMNDQTNTIHLTTLSNPEVKYSSQ